MFDQLGAVCRVECDGLIVLFLVSILSVCQMCVVHFSAVPPEVNVTVGRSPTVISNGTLLVYTEESEQEVLCSAVGVPLPQVREGKQ